MPGPVGSVIVAFDSVPELATLASAPGIREVLALDRGADGSDEQLANPAVMQTMLTTFETTFRCRCRRAEEPIAPECPDMERDVECAGYADVVVFGLARAVGCAREGGMTGLVQSASRKTTSLSGGRYLPGAVPPERGRMQLLILWNAVWVANAGSNTVSKIIP